jgi:hypothetical protein
MAAADRGRRARPGSGGRFDRPRRRRPARAGPGTDCAAEAFHPLAPAGGHARARLLVRRVALGVPTRAPTDGERAPCRRLPRDALRLVGRTGVRLYPESRHGARPPPLAARRPALYPAVRSVRESKSLRGGDGARRALAARVRPLGLDDARGDRSQTGRPDPRARGRRYRRGGGPSCGEQDGRGDDRRRVHRSDRRRDPPRARTPGSARKHGGRCAALGCDRHMGSPARLSTRNRSPRVSAASRGPPDSGWREITR